MTWNLMSLPSTVPSIVPDWRGPLNVPVILPPSCVRTIDCSALPVAPLASMVLTNSASTFGVLVPCWFDPPFRE